VAAVGVTYALGRRLYGPLCGAIAGLLLAVMPYHVIVSRQVLLDGPMTLFATVTLYCLVRYCEKASWRWMLAAGGALGVTVLSKETSAILLGSIYAFFALTPAIRLRVRHLLAGAAVLVTLFAVFPLVVRISGPTSTRNSYLLWQLGRRGNHPILFYADVIPAAVGIFTLVAALFGLIVLRRNLDSWRERLLLAWIAIPVTFFTLWPLKGYQYLLPIVPAVAVLAARGLVALYWLPWLRKPSRLSLRRGTVIVAVLLATASLIPPTWALVNPSSSGTFLAGTGGVPGGREAGRWLQKNAPVNSQLLVIGPSMANILQFYGHHRAFGLSVSSSPRDRNPAYQPVANPDRWVRDGQVQYVVWDSYTANRTPFFASKITALAERYHGVAVYTATVPVRTPAGERSRSPVVIIYQVRPA
jgi:4-amino-4-deoxy-L-arabinose transferase-like glycosyltransferase